jgi:hypothetical protein
MTDHNDRIRELAYFLWLEEGCPEGEAERHWLAAETLIESGPVDRKRTEGEPPGEPSEDSPLQPSAPAKSTLGFDRADASVLPEPKRSGRGRGFSSAE